ncbi:MAG: signal peptidase II [Ruminococcaceae bacterium]|nr:signal peptidase II [Oscillospiraceae bacterium]
MLYFVLVAVLVALDQLVKYLVSANIPVGGSVPFLPYIMDLTYVRNTGCAFSLLEEHTWLLTIVSAIMSVAIGVALAKGFFKHPLGKATLSLLLAGAVGNLIDRAFYGYVIDMFRTLFMDFAVFNVADICVVVGGVAAAAYYLFLYDKLEGKKNEQTDSDG